MKSFKFFILFFLCLKNFLFSEYLDLEEEYLQQFIVDTKRILVPGFPYAFNPSLIKYQEKYLLSFRVGKEYCYNEHNPKESYPNDPADLDSRWDTIAPSYSPNRFGLVWLDKKFNLISAPQILEIPNDNPTYRQQDPRLIVVGGKIFIVYSDIVKGTLVEETKRMMVSELFYENGHFFVQSVDCLNEFENHRDQRWEKNWVPFEYDEQLLFAYSLNPHKILFPLLNTGVCCTVATTSANTHWCWGELRGGTPAVLTDGEYLAFFHSSIAMESKQSEGKMAQHYFMGAYTFSSHPPFQLKRISSKPIVGKNFYNGIPYKTWKPHLQVVFPCGLIVDKKFIYVAYGRQDHEIWITTLDKDELYKTLVPVAPKP